MSSPRPPLVLASASPRRRHLLRRLGLSFVVREPAVDESCRPGESPRTYVRRLARAKATAVAASATESVIVAADTVVVLDGQIFGKPTGPRHAERMLDRLSGRTHEVWSGIAVVHGRCGPTRSAAVSTRVTMRRLGREEIRRYVAEGEPLDKAGAYAVQGRGRRFIERIEGDLTNVIGLPLEALARLLAETGVEVPRPVSEARGGGMLPDPGAKRRGRSVPDAEAPPPPPLSGRGDAGRRRFGDRKAGRRQP